MKKSVISPFFVLLFAFCLLCGCLSVSTVTANAEEIGKPLPRSGLLSLEFLPEDTTIVVADTLSDDAMTGAVTLQYHIQRITSNKPTIKTDSKPHVGYEICVGETNRTATVTGDLREGGYKIKSFTNGVEILGQGKRGMTYAVYEFLRKFANCEWYTSSLIVEGDYILKPTDADITYNPYFEYTDTDWSSPCDTEYSLAHGLSGGSRRQLSFFEGGSVDYVSGFCHTLSTQFCAADTYFEEHPEYFALHDGKRQGQQLCLTNPDVCAIVTEEVLDLLKENHEPSSPLQIVSLTQADNEDYCECENCRRLDKENNAHAGTMITFVNKVAQAVKDAGYDNVAIDTFAYRYTRTCPTVVKPLDNVIVRLCTIECCFTHTLDDASCEWNVALMKDLSDWGKICNRIYVWDYTTNYAHTCGIFPDFGVIQRNMQIFYENNVKGVYEEGNYYVSSCDTEFSELRAYLLSVLLQNPYCDYSTEMNRFLAAYYGEEAAPYIRSFIDKTSENAAKQHVDIYTSMQKTFSFSDEEIAEADELWAKAVSFYAGKEDDDSKIYRSRVRRSEISWLYWKASCDKGEFSGVGKYQARAELIERLNETGTVMMWEGYVYGKIPSVMALFPIDFWQEKSVLYFYVVIAVVLGILLLCALAVTIVGICKKKTFSVLYFPLTVGTVALFLWSFTVFISWSSVGLYALTCVLTVLASGLYAFLWHREKRPDCLKKSIHWGGVHGLISGGCLQTGGLFLLHGLVFAYRQPQVSFVLILCVQTAYLLFFLVDTLIRMTKKKKK